MSCFALDVKSNGRNAAMGGLDNPSGVDDMIGFGNPASIYFYEGKKKLIIQTSLHEQHSTDSSFYLEKPELFFKLQAIGKYVAVSADADTYMDVFTLTDDDKRNYTSFRRFDLDLNFAYGISNFVAIGAGIQVGSSLKKTDIIIDSEEDIKSFLTDGFLAQHTREINSEYADISLGMIFKKKGITFAVKSDKMLSYEAEKGNQISFDKALETLGCGLYFDQGRYTNRGRLRNWVLSAGLECCNLGTRDEILIKMGAEGLLQLSRNYGMSLRLGYFSSYNRLRDTIVPVGLYDTHYTAGIGLKIGILDIALSCAVPVEVTRGEDGAVKAGIDISFMF